MKTFLLVTALTLSGAHGATGGTVAVPAMGKDTATSRVQRERQFLQRAMEELNRSHGYVQTMAGELERQIDTIEFVGSSGREADISSFFEWYASYTDWLGSNISVLDENLASVYSDERGGVVQPAHCRSIAAPFARSSFIISMFPLWAA